MKSKLTILFIGNSLPVFESILKNSNATIQNFVTENRNLSILGNHVLGPNFELSYQELMSSIDHPQSITKMDLGICASFGVLPTSLLDIPNIGFINIHPAELPLFAGKYPYPQLIESEVNHSYSTVHLMTEKIDEGKILARSRYKIGKHDFYDDWLTSSGLASCQALNNFLDSSPRKVFKNISSVQEPLTVTYNPKSSFATRDLAISPNLSLYDAIRINSKVGGTKLFRENGAPVLIYKAIFTDRESEKSEVFQVLNLDHLGFDIGLGGRQILRVTNWFGETLRENEKLFRIKQDGH